MIKSNKLFLGIYVVWKTKNVTWILFNKVIEELQTALHHKRCIFILGLGNLSSIQQILV